MSVTRTLYLHMGHAKTGSSWIQTSLRMSQDALAAHEIRYAEGDRLAVDADRRITSGNGVGLLDSEASMAARLGRSDIAPDASILFSREHWGSDLDPSLASHLSRIAEQHGFERVSVLLFIRNPIGHASSAWQQAVKRGSRCQRIEDFYREYAFPQKCRTHLGDVGQMQRRGSPGPQLLAMQGTSVGGDRRLAGPA